MFKTIQYSCQLEKFNNAPAFAFEYARVSGHKSDEPSTKTEQELQE